MKPIKKVLLACISIFFLSGCSTAKSMEVFSFDARTQDVALENVVLVASDNEVYLQPTFQLFGIEKLNGGADTSVKGAVINLYDEERELIYSFGMGENQNGILNTQTTPLDGDLVGTILDSKNIKAGKKLFVEFIYEKDSMGMQEEVVVELKEM